MSIDGWSSLHNLELAAYAQSTEEDSFTAHYIPNRAAELAARFSHIVSLFHPSSTINEDSLYAQGALSNREDFKEIFERALKLKVKTKVADSKFQFEIHPPGTESTAKNSATGHEQLGKWLHATMHVYRAQPSVLYDQFADAIVQANNFANKSDTEHLMPLGSVALATDQRAIRQVCLLSLLFKIFSKRLNSQNMPRERGSERFQELALKTTIES
jgi:hypothetical protein